MIAKTIKSPHRLGREALERIANEEKLKYITVIDSRTGEGIERLSYLDVDDGVPIYIYQEVERLCEAELLGMVKIIAPALLTAFSTHQIIGKAVDILDAIAIRRREDRP